MLLKNKKFIIAVYYYLLLTGCSIGASEAPQQNLDQTSLADLARQGAGANLEIKLWMVPQDLNRLDERGRTPLHEAVCRQHASTVGILCNNPLIELGIYSRDGLAALHYAILKGRCACRPGATCNACKIVTTILNKPNVEVDLPVCGYDGFFHSAMRRRLNEGATALHFAAHKGDMCNILRLISKGARATCMTKKSETPLHFAAAQHDHHSETIQIINTLCCKGADINEKDCLGYTPLHVLINSQSDAAADDTDIAKCMLDLGADINGHDCGFTPLMAAVMQRKYKMVNFLLDNGALMDVKNPYGYTALDLAIGKGLVTMKRILLARGAHCALCQNDHDFEFWARYPIHAAASCGDEKILQDLIARDTKNKLINSQTEDGSTPLHFAVREGHAEIVNYLLSQGASFKIQSAQGSPERLAETLHRPDIVRILQQGNIGEIAAEHQKASPYDLPQNVGKPVTEISPDLPLQGMIVPSLQQTRDENMITAYCGYYALYNALSFIRPQEYSSLDRVQFVRFFEDTLRAIRDYRGHAPFDNLISNEIRYLINTRFNNLPIIAIEQNDFLLRANGVINTIEESFDHDARTQNLLLRFLNQAPNKIDQLAVVAGIGNASGHWIAMLFSRKPGGAVSVFVADSLRQPECWPAVIAQTVVLPFYLALTTAFDEWPTVLSAAMIHEIMPELSAPDLKTTKDTKDADNTGQKDGQMPSNPLAHQLLEIMAYTKALDKSLETYLSTTGIKQVDVIDKLLINLQMAQLSKLSISVLYMLHGYQIEIEDKDPQHEFIDKLQDQLLAIPEKISDLQKLNATAATTGSIFKDVLKIQVYRKFFREFRENARNLITKLQVTQTEINLMPRLDQNILTIAFDNIPQAKNVVERMSAGRQVRALICGPAGTGKSTLACAIAKKVQEEDKAHNRPERPVIFRNVALIKNNMQYCVEETFKKLIEPYVTSGKPAIIIIDELDALGGNTREEFLSQSKALNGLVSADSQVSFIVTANNTDIIEETLLSRFKRDKLQVDTPSLECRKKILCYHLTHVDGFTAVPEVMEEQNIEYIAERMNGCTARDIESLVEQTLGAILLKHEKVRSITFADLKMALGSWVPTKLKLLGTFSRAAVARTGEFLGNNWQFFVQTGLSCASMKQIERHYQEQKCKAPWYVRWLPGIATTALQLCAQVAVSKLFPGAPSQQITIQGGGIANFAAK